jgi:hypothetical protein
MLSRRADQPPPLATDPKRHYYKLTRSFHLYPGVRGSFIWP